MNKKNERLTRLVERGKDVLIVLLTCSAIWLAGQGHWAEKPAEPDPGETAPMLPEDGVSAARAGMLRPLTIVANRVGAAGDGRCALQYDTAEKDVLFQRTAGLLVEALSSAEEPREITRSQWENALTDLPGLTFDFRGTVPAEVLLGWLTGEETQVPAAVRRLILAVHLEQVTLYYRDENTGTYYRSQTQAVNRTHLEEALASLTDNGAFYAFEADWAEDLDPDTLLRPEIPGLPVYTAANPAAGGREMLESLMADLGFAVNTSSFYTSGDELVARSGSEMLRLSDRGTLRYEADSETGEHFRVRELSGGGALTETVEACRQIAAVTLSPRSGQARLYLDGVRLEEDRMEVDFQYALNGLPVSLSEGPAARFEIRGRNIVRYELRFADFEPSDQLALVMPPRQAAAVLGGMDLEGEELMLVYSETGAGTAAPGWAAVRPAGEKE